LNRRKHLLTVYKLDHNGREVWQYPAHLLERGAHYVRLEAFFNRDDMDLGYTTFKRGDRFVETFYDDRWYNVFAVYDSEDGGLKGWYCNVCRPARITATAVCCDDLALDVWITADGRPVVLDEDEFVALPISAHDRARARDALTELLEPGKSGRPPA
jgi:hypothetical protein